MVGPKNGDDLPKDSNPADGYPPQIQKTPEKRSVNTDQYETTKVEGTPVPLAPIEDIYYWYARREARFIDSRSESSYSRSSILGAVVSPAPDGKGKRDVVEQWPKDDRIICYCSCPHHLSSMRAASLLSNGYENVLVIDEGFREWSERDYPVGGADVESLPPLKVIEDRTRKRFAGQTVWARHLASGQMEATRIESTGRYRLKLPFADVDRASIIVVETPDYRIRNPLGVLMEQTVTELRAH